MSIAGVMGADHNVNEVMLPTENNGAKVNEGHPLEEVIYISGNGFIYIVCDIWSLSSGKIEDNFFALFLGIR